VNRWLEWMHSDEYQEMAKAEDRLVEEHWANNLLDAPHSLISVIETKISRAEIQAEKRERQRIIKLLETYEGCRNEFCNYYCECLRSDFFVELIKGEQK